MGKPENAGTFGDMFGAINALFSGAAFAGTIYAILLQRKDLETQHKQSFEQAKDFAEQLRLIQKQTDALAGQLEESKKQSQTISDQLDEHKKQTLAINQQAKETEKQTHNILEQIKLSIMPAFVIEIKQGVSPQVDKPDERTANPNAYAFYITNIGNGTGTNIHVENIPIQVDPSRYDKAFIRFRPRAFLKKGEKIDLRNQAIGLKKELGDSESYLKDYNTNLDGNVRSISYVFNNYHENNLLPVKISFSDIKGVKYKQTIQIGRNISIPGEVIEVEENS